jgi:hypothetical protein
VRTLSRTMNSLVNTRPERNPKQTAVCVWARQKRRGETGRLLAMRLRELRHNLKERRSSRNIRISPTCLMN